MDPATALGFSANVFQVVHFSIGVVSNGIKIYKSADGRLDEFSAVEKLATDLSDCNTKLLTYLPYVDPKQQWLSPPTQGNGNATLVSEDRPPVKSSRVLNSEEQAMAELCRDCNRIAETLLSKLEKVRFMPGPKRNEWRAARTAIRAAWDQSEIDSINSRLWQYREQLNTRLLLSVR